MLWACFLCCVLYKEDARLKYKAKIKGENIRLRYKAKIQVKSTAIVERLFVVEYLVN